MIPNSNRAHSNRSDKNPFVLAEEKFNRSFLRLRNAGDFDNSAYPL